MGGDESGLTGITFRELLLEMREDIRALRSAVDAAARDQALSVERRASMQRLADTITARLDSHEKAILVLQRWRDEAAGAIRLARWARASSPRSCVRPSPGVSLLDRGGRVRDSRAQPQLADFGDERTCAITSLNRAVARPTTLSAPP